MTNQQQNSNENVSNNGVYDIPKQKKKIKKRWIILGIIAIVVIAGFINGKSSNTNTKEKVTSKAENKSEIYKKGIWPEDSPLAQMLPIPDAKDAELICDSQNYFCIEIIDKDIEWFKEYKKQCRKNGFTVNYSSSDTIYSAENDNGDKLFLDYDEDDEHRVCISLRAVSQETDENTQDSNSDSDDTISDSDDKSNTDKNNNSNSDKSEKNNKSDSGVSPDFKKAMDSYEKTMNEYVKFMKKYSESDNSLSMAADYAKYLKKYTDTMDKLDAIDEDSLSDADLEYYIEVSGRITSKLAEVAAQ